MVHRTYAARGRYAGIGVRVRVQFRFGEACRVDSKESGSDATAFYKALVRHFLCGRHVVHGAVSFNAAFYCVGHRHGRNEQGRRENYR